MINAINLETIHTSNSIKINKWQKAFACNIKKDRLCYVKN